MTDGSPGKTRFQLMLFGGPELLIGNEPCSLSPREGGFLGLLYGWDEEGMGRDAVVSLFWPNDSPQRARRRLNQLLYSIKKKTGTPAPFSCRRDRIFPANEWASSDLDGLRPGVAVEGLYRSAQVFPLGFLRRSDGRISEQFSGWIQERERELRSTLTRRLQREMASCESKADWEGSRAASEALSILAPLDEGILRGLMKARSRVGGSGEAEAAFMEFSSRTEATLGSTWGPEKETLALLERIRSEELTGERVEGQKARKEREEPRLVGRDSEHALLRRTLAKPPHRAFRGILITGEAGIGKTRLIKESVLGLSLEGQGLFWAEQAELEQLIPLNPLIEAFREPRVGEALSSLDEPWRAVLYGVMPEHFRGAGPIPQAPQIQPGSVPRRLFEAFHQLLAFLVSKAPVTLLIEDLQWADETTLSVLDFLIRRWDQGQIQAVFSLRSEEVRRTPALRSFLEMLRVHEDFLEITLGDLSGSASKALMMDLSEQSLSPTELTHLQSLAGGNPFFLIEMTLEYLAGRVDQPALPEGVLSIPLSIRQVLDRRLSQLSPSAEKALGALSVYSKALRIADLGNIAGLTTSECMSGLDQLHEFRLVRSRGVEVSVGHELIRQTVYQGLSSTRKAWLHHRLARHLEASSANPPPDELAIHFHFAGAEKEALTFSRIAAARAEGSGAIPEALRFLGLAREHTDEPEEVAEIIGRMGHLNYLHQNLEEAAPLLEAAAQRFRRQGLDEEALKAEMERVDSLGQTGRLPFRECLGELGRIKKEAREAEYWETFMRALDVELHLFDRAGDLVGVRKAISDAGRHAQEGDEKARCHARSVLALNLYFGAPKDGLAAAREAVDIALRTGTADLELLALNRLIVVLLYQGRLHTPEGARALQAAEQRFASSGDLSLKFFIRLNRAVWHLEVGELDKAALAIKGAEAVIRGTKARIPRTMMMLNRGELELELNQADQAFASFSEALDLLSDSSPGFFRTIIVSGLGLCALRDGNLGEAKRLECALPDLPTHWTFDPSVVASFKVEMLRMRGDLRMADKFLEAVAHSIKNRFVTGWIKVNILRVKILKRIRPDPDLSFGQETLDLVRKLELHSRSRELERLLI